MTVDISGVIVSLCTVIPDERGCVLKVATPIFDVKDVYMTTVAYGAIKAWHGYETKEIHFTCVSGKVKLVLWDARPGKTSGTIEEIYLSDKNMLSVHIPPGVYAGFKGLSMESMILVQASEPYGQIYRIPYNSVPYDWEIQHG